MTSAPSATPIAPPTHRQHHRLDQDLQHDVAVPRAHALRMPISRVRSVTLTSMMFMMTMPPTTSEMQVTGTTTAAIIAQHLIDEAADRIRRQRVEIVRLAGTRVEAGAQRDPGLVEGSLHAQAAPRPGRAEERQAVPGPYMRLNTVSGMYTELSRLRPKEEPSRSCTPMTRELDALDPDLLIRAATSPGKERGSHVLADHRHKARERSSCSVKKRPSTTGYRGCSAWPRQPR